MVVGNDNLQSSPPTRSVNGDLLFSGDNARLMVESPSQTFNLNSNL
ncbi:hypothetical protein HanXRQr2_Chr04g0185321 [Helianthus annuus]|uniref:Uncharacterized protein n=1 Tax=Helianthus annuus TaxID=4232 RepID=A0A9K3JBE7_HELAN|nr:hypothetical protein HanXRQr2_Chr04g0185321 [Helianthus annuus]KAJ0932889.1 hypothetical protein HanPSC8_Chr04g0178871 [Helianthus annuus]